MKIQHNPFYYGGVIQQRHLFVNRTEEVIEIYEALLASASVSVVGERRVGKSSLLWYLADRSVAREFGLDPNKYLFTYFEFLGFPTITPTELWRELLRNILGQLRDPRLAKKVVALITQETIGLIDLQQLLLAFEKADLNLVILFDEFDAAATNPNFDLTFFGGLRNLSKYRLSYIIASQRSLLELYYANPDAIGSPFFNIFRVIRLRGFASHEVETLLTRALKDTTITFNEQDRELLDSLASGHPYFLQMGAYYVFNAYRYYAALGQHTRRQTIWIKEHFRDNAAQHFRYYWERSEAGEKLILATLSLLDAKELERYDLYPDRNDIMLRRLRNRVLVVQDEQGPPHIFSTIFAQWITETVSFVPIDKVEDLKAAIDEAKTGRFKKAWLDTTGRIRRGFAWLDVKSIVKWAVGDKNAEEVIDLISKLLNVADGGL